MHGASIGKDDAILGILAYSTRSVLDMRTARVDVRVATWKSLRYENIMRDTRSTILLAEVPVRPVRTAKQGFLTLGTAKSRRMDFFRLDRHGLVLALLGLLGLRAAPRRSWTRARCLTSATSTTPISGVVFLHIQMAEHVSRYRLHF